MTQPVTPQDTNVGTLKAWVDDAWEETVPVGTPGPPGGVGLTGPTGPSGPDGPAGGPVPAGGVAYDAIVKTGPGDFEVAWDRAAHTGAILQNGAMKGGWNSTTEGTVDGAGTSRWTVTLDRSRYLVLFGGTALSTANGHRDIRLDIDGVRLGYSRLYCNNTNVHRAFSTAVIRLNTTPGEHTFSIHEGGSVSSDGNDYASIVLLPLPSVQV